MRTYGTADLHDGRWLIQCEPHVMIRLKRHFSRVEKTHTGAVMIADTPEVARDLEWFCERFPLNVNPAGHLEVRSLAHRIREEDIEEILQGRHRSLGGLKLALQLREYQQTAAALLLRAGRLLLADDVGLGKAQPLDAKILTPTGWRRMGDLAIGDEVVDPDGGAGQVTGIYPQGEQAIYQLVTKDLEAAECTVDHLWGVYSANDRRRGGALRVLPLAELLGDVTRPYGGGKRTGWATSKWFLPIPQPVTFAPLGALPLDPYLLGVLIGDGALSRDSVTIMKPDTEIIDELRRLLPAGVELRPTGQEHTWRLARTAPTGSNPVIDALRYLGLFGKLSVEKSIPLLYLRASVEDRLQLLRGLMDTDGDCTKEGGAIFNTSSPTLRDGAVDLVRSLGGIASVSTKADPRYVHKGEERVGHEAYRLNVRMVQNPFSLERKAARWKPSIMARAIAAITRTRRAQAQCIRVSTKRNLYVTDGYIVTHNTAVGIGTFTDPRALPALVVTLTHLPRQWQDEIAKFAPSLRTHILRGTRPYDLTGIADDPRSRTGRRLKRARSQTEIPGAEASWPDVIITSYSKLEGWSDVLAGKVTSVIFDETQELRHAKSGREPVRKYVAAQHIAGRASFRLGLSATPIYNYGSEFFNVLDVIAPGDLGQRDEFVREWCGPDDNGKASIKDPRAFGAMLRDSGLMLRRTRADVGRELPPLTKVTHHVDADSEALDAIGNDIAELARVILRPGGERGDAMKASGEIDWMLRQATGVAKAVHVAAFVRLLVESGERVVLYGWHHRVYEIWQEKLEDLHPVMFTGQESIAQKLEAKQAFIAGESPVLIMSLRAGAGLDGLQGKARIVVFGELDWSPGVHEQAIGRVHRDGQQEQVIAYFLVSDEGSDPIVAQVLGLKRVQIEGVRDPNLALVEKLDTGGGHIRKLAEDVLRRRGEHPVRARS